MKNIEIQPIEIPIIELDKILLENRQKNASRNLLLESDKLFHDFAINVGNYNISDPSLLKEGTKVTCSIWGDLGSLNKNWLFTNSDLHCVVAGGTSGHKFVYRENQHIWTTKAIWTLKYNSIDDTEENKEELKNMIAANNIVKIFHTPASISMSTIYKIKLELGWNDNPIWTPAPEDIK